MLPYQNRVTDKYDFNRLRRFGKTYTTPLLLLSYFKDQKNQTAPSKIGIIVNNKIDKRAVVRHRIKRLVLTCVQKRLSSFGLGYFVVFVAKPSIVGKNYEEVSSCINKALSEISFS